MAKYVNYKEKYRDQLTSLIEQLQGHIANIDTFDRVIVGEQLGEKLLHKYLSQIRKLDGDIYLAIDENSEEVLGYSIAVLLERSKAMNLEVKPGMYGEIAELFVVENRRGKGIGKKLFSLAEEKLRQLKCDFIEITVFGDNKNALSAYKKYGYREREYKLLKKLK
jgi:ribosomal protein S18 acetylase RimI-like enzyme